MHGLMVTGEMFDPVVERFATEHHVIVPGLRGHGRSRRDCRRHIPLASWRVTYRACSIGPWSERIFAFLCAEGRT